MQSLVCALFALICSPMLCWWRRISSSRLMLIAALLMLGNQPLYADGISMSDLQMIEDPAARLGFETALGFFREKGGEALPEARFNAGHRDSVFWFYGRVTNTSRAPLNRLIDSGIYFRKSLSIWIIHPGAEPRLILSSSDTQPFAARNPPRLRLVSETFSVDPLQSSEIVIRSETRGHSYLAFRPMSQASIISMNLNRASWSAAFYGVAIILLLVFALFGLATKDRFVIAYGTFFAMILLLIAASEGYAFQFIWPAVPEWQQYSVLVLLLLSSVMGFGLASAAMGKNNLQSQHLKALRFMRTGLNILGLCSGALILLTPIFSFSLLADIGNCLFVICLCAHCCVIASWAKHAPRHHSVSFIVSLVFLPIIGLLLLAILVGGDIPDVLILYSPRIIYFVAMITTLVAIFLNILALHKDHQKALENALAAARRDAEMNRALLEAEQKYTRAQALAQQHQQQLASTSHDIRQPLVSLRASIGALVNDIDQASRENLYQALDYLEHLSHSHKNSDEGGRAYDQDVVPDQEECPYRADVLLSATVRMFEQEASEKHIRLYSMPCSALITQPPLVIMRILNNFTANALKHFEGDELPLEEMNNRKRVVLLGCRRLPGELRFDVIDNGAGISEADVKRIFDYAEKGESSEGDGLGLSICRSLAQSHGYAIDYDSALGTGSRFSIVLPRRFIN